MKIEVLYFEGCPNHEPAIDAVREVLQKLDVAAEIDEVNILGPEEALEHKFLGSPSIRIDGVDVEPAARSRTDFGYSCRTYADGAGTPTLCQIECALKSALETSNTGMVAAPRAAMAFAGSGTYAALGTFGAAALSSACCWLPLMLIGLGISAGGLGAFFETARPVFLGLTAILLAIGFYVVYFRKPVCEEDCAPSLPTPRMNRFNRGSLWVSTVGALLFALFPYYVDALPLGDAQIKADPAYQSAQLVSMPVLGMTCSGCATTVEQAIRETPGVVFATVDFDAARLDVRLDAQSPASHEQLLQTLRDYGFDSVD